MRNTNHNMRGDRKKLSWIYRNKTKFQRSQNATSGVDDCTEDNKRPRIIVRNLPFKATANDITKFFEPFGHIEEVHFPKRPDGSPVGCCFIEYKQLTDASKAIFNTNKKEFQGRIISSSWAISKSKYCEKLEREATETVDDAEGRGTSKDVESSKEEPKQELDASQKEGLIKKQERRKSSKEKSRKKRARIVIRNLAFHTNEENLKEHFAQYGAIEDVNVLRRSDGKSVGCAFIQFEHVQSAAKAIHYANLQPLLDRPVVVDWAVPKNKFSKDEVEGVKEEVEIKVEKESDTEDSPTAECARKSNSNEELGSEDEEHVDIATDESDDEDLINESEVKSENDSEVSAEDAKEKITGDEEETIDAKEIKRPRFESHDVSEGKTIFLKNVPFSVKNEPLKKYMERFGPVYYALVCMDSLTEYSKGTAFVKFKNIEDAEMCLAAGKDLVMEDQLLEAHRAIDRNELENKANSKQHRQKDSRNLYLVKEGVIMAGSPAAVGVSAADMAKRLQIEQWKSQILRNLNMFVSRIRLVIHNLPATFDDAKLRKVVERYGPPNAVIREARVMRDLKNVDMKAVGKSKEYAFVSFTTHDDALQALRSINNNPNVFTPKRRPIVSFSIENRVMVNAKQKRAQKSRENNPLWPGNKAKRKGENTNEEVPTKKFKAQKPQKTERIEKTKTTDDSNKKSYSGMVAKPGENKLRTKFKLRTQAALHNQTVKKEKKMKKSTKKLQEKRRNRNENKKEAKPKQRTKVKADDVNLDKLVNRYKNKLNSIELKKSKWYES